MQIKTYRFVFFAVLLLLNLYGLNAQTLYPGDINNNGEVTGVDFLYWGLAYGETGPARTGATNAWEVQNISTPWVNSFPDARNQAYADANGDGIVNEDDLATAFWPNYGLRHGGSPLSDGYSTGILNIHPELILEPAITETTPGTKIDVGVSLGTESIPVENFYGIAFSLEYTVDRVDSQFGASFQATEGSWIDPSGTASYPSVVGNNDDGTIDVAITRIDQNSINSGFGNIGVFSIVIEDNVIGFYPVDTLRIKIDNVRLIDENLNTTPVAYRDAEIYIRHDDESPISECPTTVAPVCGSNGVTYLNACYAIAEGITNYTVGVCYDACVDASQMIPSPNCQQIYDPVCGCNEVTYINECEARAAGVISYVSGACDTDGSCYDPLLVLASSNTSLDAPSGVIEFGCEEAFQDPVCGCNGVTYVNDCTAEANGISYYTRGVCESDCVDSEVMYRDPTCETVYDPVCGCNGETYINACQADAAGITTYTPGACESSTWCSEALAIDCGLFLTNESTVGTGNNIENYPGCLNSTLEGPDRVYVFNKTTTGDIQIGLEIVTAGLDLDIFLLKGECDNVTCLAGSYTDNTSSNNEGIVYENAPVGTYYIVVDGQYTESEGLFNLELSCGTLICDDAIELKCGQPIEHTTVNGRDDVSLYTCANGRVNVENNGPEVVHTFTIAQGGIIDIELSDLSANLEMFLLGDCGRGRCLKDSQNPGTADERISTYLDAGTYYLVVDGYNGAASSYTLELNCPTECSCGMEIDVNTTNTTCGQNGGVMVITSSGGTPAYVVSWEGPVNGSFVTFGNTCTLTGFPAGTYEVTKTDGTGCSASETVVISDGFSFTAMPVPTACGSTGAINISIGNGTPGYHVEISGPEDRDFITGNNNINVNNLPPGVYQVYITDINGCCTYQLVTIEEGNSNFTFVANGSQASCNEFGSIPVNVLNGSGPYTIVVSGPTSGTAVAQTSNFTIRNLPGGTYWLKIIDQNDCVEAKEVTIASTDLTVQTQVVNGLCNQLNAINVNISGGSPNYNITWTGPTSGGQTTFNRSSRISNLPNGSYRITTIDASGCSDFQTVTVQNSNTGIDFNATSVSNTCGAAGAIWLDISTGNAPYSISWNGPQSGTGTTPTNGFSIPELVNGNYIITVTDADGCSAVEVNYVNTGTGLSVDVSANGSACGDGGLNLSMSGAPAPYDIIWTGTTSGTVNTEDENYTLNLAEGNYAVNVFSANGCGNVQNVTVNSGGDVQTILNIQPGECGNPGSVVVTAQNAIGPYSLSWVGPTPGESNYNTPSYMMAGLASGIYQINLTTGDGCVSTETFNIVNEAPLVMTSTPSASNCGEDGAINIQINGNNAPYAISWSGAEEGSATATSNSFLIPDLSAGSYTVMVTDPDGCIAEQLTNVENTGGIAFDAQGNPSTCTEAGSIDLNITGTGNIYRVTWNGPISGETTSGIQSFNIPNLLAGVYLVNVTNENDCSISQNVTITDAGSGIEIQSIANTGNCGSTASINVDIIGGTAIYNISWTGPTEGSAMSNSSSYTIPDLISGEYVISVSDANNCVATMNVTTETNSELVLDSTPSDVSCHGTNDGSIVVSSWGGTPPYAYQWSNGETESEIDELFAANYTVTATDANGCMIVEMITVEEPHELYLLMSGTEPSCNNNNGTATAQVGGGVEPYTYEWSNGDTQATITGLTMGTYTVTVTDANNCLIVNSETLGTSGQMPTVNFTYTQDALTFYLNNQSSTGTYVWSFGDGETSTEAHPTHVFCEESTYEICLTATTDCGTDTYCEYVQAHIPSDYVVIEVGSVVGGPNTTIGVPVTTRNISNLVSIAGSLQVEDANVGTIEALQAGKIEPQFNIDNQTFSYYEASGEGVVLADNDTLFYVMINLTDQAGSSSDILLHNTPLVIEVGGMVNGTPMVLDHVSLKGGISIDENAELEGWVETYWGEGVNGVAVEVTCSSCSEVLTTDQSGLYQIDNIPYGDETTISASKSTNPDNGLSTFSLFLGQRFILGMPVDAITSPYQVIAGDANCSNSFTTLDLFIIQQMIIGTRSEFPDCPSWVFVTEDSPMPTEFDAYNVFPYETTNTLTITKDTTANFIGVKVGDILGQANPQNFSELFVDTRNQLDELRFLTENQTVSQGETFDVVFNSDNFNNIVSIQMGMNWDDSRLDFVSFAPNEMTGTVAATPEETNNTIRMSWFDTQGVGADFEEDANLFTIRFTALEDISSFESILEIDTVSFQTEAHNSDLEAMDIVLVFEEESNTTKTHSVEKLGYQLYQNVPNPFATSTRIVFELPAVMEAELIIYNTVGQVVRSFKDSYRKGKNRIDLQKEDLANGVYYYSLRTTDFAQTRKMTILK